MKMIREVENSTKKFTREAKQTYYEQLGNKFSDLQTGHKHFWSAFQRITNKKMHTNIPPIITVDVTSPILNKNLVYSTTTLLINAKLHANGSRLPEFISKTNSFISHIKITTDQIVHIIKKYNTNKARGYDKISVAMLQLCAAEVAIPLGIIFTGIFPDSWKYANVQPVQKKTNRQLISNYRSISLLPICGKITNYLKTNQDSG